jgi:GntR family transcriptional repressor for pyruvate dehydrogenase complex
MNAPVSGPVRPSVPPARPRANRLAITPGRRQRLGDQLYGQILDQIVAGQLAEGERLPSEAQLCEMFGVSRPVVREALQRLRADGLVLARQGSGTFVMARPAARLTSFAAPADIALFLRCIEVRLPLEGAAAALAAERRTPAQLARIEEAHAAFGQSGGQIAMQPESDMSFHRSIAEAAGNELFVTCLEHVRETLTGFMHVSLSLTRTGPKERAVAVMHEHRQIVEAIRAQDAETARIAMQFHISQARLRMIDRNRETSEA